MQNGATQNQAPVVVVSLIGLVALWAAAAWWGGDSTVLPGPNEVWGIFLSETASGELPRHVIATLRRVVLAFALAMVFGVVIGIAMGMNVTLNRWFGAWLVVLLNVPALVVIVLCYLWIGLNEVAAITAVALNKTAMVAVTIREGVHALDPKLKEMSQAYRMSAFTRLRHVILPQLWPYLASSTRNGLAIIWKIVLVVEFLGRSDGVGFQIHLYFQLFETGYVLAYALSFVALMLVLEYGVIGVMERRATRWRRPSHG
ncbi:NitT/TauT family transport system permease protein [Litoreibacter meonggei]|uniref:NitT/TauT family transport system permease protein n=1 Tax=Litoreibacter meonggei TaxID=1049199 RepID=A0A497WQP7_9RHOB|nr:ABC transporter permease [Litoreibacter meonggei]RLJ58882.1 NitT/TauT family transport system permease protein [Litoreibacter meonggei]